MTLHRRTLVRAGVTTAWTAPLVAIAVPAHAAACSGGVTELTAQEIPGYRTEQYDSTTGRLTVGIALQLTNSGATRSLVSASAFGMFAPIAFLAIVGEGGTGGFINLDPPGEAFVEVPLSPAVPLGSPRVQLQYESYVGTAKQIRVEVTLQPDCGQPAIISFTSTVPA